MHDRTSKPPFRGLLLAVGLVLAAGCSDRATPPPTAIAPGEIEFLNQGTDVEYVGMEACRDCHEGIYLTYSETGMGKAFYPLTADNSVEHWTENNEFAVEESGVHYRMFERDGKFYQRQFLLDSEGNELAGDERELVYVIGSNNHSRSYATFVDKKMFQAPACWYPQAEKWDLCPGYEFKNEHFWREISMSCIHCHNGRMETVEGERNQFHEPYPLGIGCERCHGPGRLHVERWADEEPKGEPDPTIVNPRRLPQPERIEVCFQCHFGDSKASERVARYQHDLLDFRPGQRMTDVTIPFRLAHETEYDFGISAQADRMILSRCYTESEGKLECLTCHNPHVTVYHPQRPRDFFKKKCQTCHDVGDCTESMEARAETALPDDCVACHMRTAEPDDQRYTTFTDHWIRKDTRIDEPDHRESFEVEPVYPEQLASFDEGERAFYHGRASSLLARDATEPIRISMWEDAEGYFREAIAKGFDNESSWFFLGKMLTRLNKTAEARDAYAQAVRHDPNYEDAQFALGRELIKLNEVDRALEVFGQMLKQDPDNPMALSEYGRIQWARGNNDEALRVYQHAVGLEPWSHTLQHNLAGVLASMGRMDEATEVAARAVALDPDRLSLWEFNMNALRHANRPEDAAEAERMVKRLQEMEKTKQEGKPVHTAPILHSGM